MRIKQKVAILTIAAFGIGFMSMMPAPVAAKALKCEVLPQSICGSSDNEKLQDNGVWKLLILVLNILTAGVGITAVGAIAFAGFLYASANDDSNKTKQAKEMIRNTIIGIVLYGLMYVGLQFLIPGGVFA